MMQRQRIVQGLLLLVLAVLSGLWLWRRVIAPAPPRLPRAATPAAAAPTATVIPSETPVQAPPGYRLAGVAVGEPDSFAVIEGPNGSNTLYRVGADIPGLGRLVLIEAERVVVEGKTGKFEMWLAPAATATPAREPTAGVRRPTPKAVPRAAGGGKAP